MARQVFTISGRRISRTITFVTSAIVPSDPVSRPTRSSPGRSTDFPPVSTIDPSGSTRSAGRPEAPAPRAAPLSPAVAAHPPARHPRPGADLVVGPHPAGGVGGPAGVPRDIPADGARALARRVGRVEVPAVLHRQRDL